MIAIAIIRNPKLIYILRNTSTTDVEYFTHMILVVPLGFLVNTEHIIGSHYGRRDAISGRLYQ